MIYTRISLDETKGLGLIPREQSQPLNTHFNTPFLSRGNDAWRRLRPIL